jgi:hypothetical protein
VGLSFIDIMDMLINHQFGGHATGCDREFFEPRRRPHEVEHMPGVMDVEAMDRAVRLRRGRARARSPSRDCLTPGSIESWTAKCDDAAPDGLVISKKLGGF